jgi:hypothetical protein
LGGRVGLQSVRQSTIAVALVLMFAVGITAQTKQGPGRFKVVLLGGVPSEKIHINYVLYGPFGASGGFTTPNLDSLSYWIPTSVHGKAAEHIKGFIWASGCKITTFDSSLLESADVQEYFACTPLGTVTLVGRIRATDLPRRKPTEVRFDYIAPWACRFFGFGDCAVPQIEIGTVKPDADGAFEIELPDLSADPISSESEGGAELQMVLREVKTWNLVALLEPETKTLLTPGGALKIAPSYPQNLLFAARKDKPSP